MVQGITNNFLTSSVGQAVASAGSAIRKKFDWAQGTIAALGQQSTYSPPKIRDELQKIVDRAPQFAGYKIGQGTRFYGTLTDLPVRPANLFFDALFGPNAVTLPGSGELFAFTRPHEEIRNQIASKNPDEIVSFSALGVRAPLKCNAQQTRYDMDLSHVLGKATYRISYGEIQETLASQKIFVSPLLPISFYKDLKEAMLKDGIVVLPESAYWPVKVCELNTPHCAAVIQRAEEYFSAKEECQNILELSLYQLGSLVVKSEDFRILLDPNGKLIERTPGERDAIRLINACGIRGVAGPTKITNSEIVKSTFRTALIAAERDFVVFPAVGMGVWGGDPNLYWRSFLEAVAVSGSDLDKIFVNPGHQKTPRGKYAGYRGEEFAPLLKEYRMKYKSDPVASANLSKIVDLYEKKTDVVQLAHQLKKHYPDKMISLFNASDPDVTLGNHVGEYVNNLGHGPTTEENYTAMGTNGLCFETITGVHENPDRVIQANF